MTNQIHIFGEKAYSKFEVKRYLIVKIVQKLK